MSAHKLCEECREEKKSVNCFCTGRDRGTVQDLLLLTYPHSLFMSIIFCNKTSKTVSIALRYASTIIICTCICTNFNPKILFVLIVNLCKL